MCDVTKSCMSKRSIQSLRQTNGFYVREQKYSLKFHITANLEKTTTCQVLV